MKKILKKILQNRLVAFGLILAVELAWLLIFLTELVNYSTVISILFTVLSLLVVLWMAACAPLPGRTGLQSAGLS